MPKPTEPIFPKTFSHISGQLFFECRDDTVTYYNGMMPVFSHHKNDLQTFYMISAQFYINGNASQADIARAAGVNTITIKRAVKKYREGGPQAFYQDHKRGGPTVLKPDVVEKAEDLFASGMDDVEVAEELGLKIDTLKKGIQKGRVKKKFPNLKNHLPLKVNGA